MTTIVRLGLETGPGAPDPWVGVASRAVRWAREAGVELRDAIVLLPFAQLLPLARRAFARSGGWMPRIETTQTLAAALGPPAAAEPGQLSFDASIDALVAAQLLRSQPWGAAWARRDARGFARAVGDVVAAAHAMARAAAALPPGDRDAHWAAGRELLGPAAGPGATERLLARVALEWASLAPLPSTDRLFDARPSAWIVVRAGGEEPLATALTQQSGIPCLVLDADAPLSFDTPPAHAVPDLVVCDSFEQQAQRTAACVLEHLNRGEQPVGLIAQDRLLVRRVRALLERARVPMLDETGWKLSTTRAAAQVMSLLKVARPDAGTDALFDWLKAGARVGGLADSGVAMVEAMCRRRHVRRVAEIDPAPLGESLARAWAAVPAVLELLNRVPRQPLAAWLDALTDALRRCGSLAELQADDAGRQVHAALKLDPAARQAVAAIATPMSLDEFSAWVDGVLEQASFRPAAPAAAQAPVVIMPLARAMLRPFAALVFPGADDRHLGLAAAPTPLLSDAQAGALGLPTAETTRQAREQAFLLALAAPRITFLRSRLEGTDPLADSPLVERLAFALRRQGRALNEPADARLESTLPATPITRGAPAAPALLPNRWSASSLEALRACPYRFFALHMLRLREDDELDSEVEKRDYGTWLHAVLHRFHATRGAPASLLEEVDRLNAVALELRAEHALDDAEFLPYAASFASLAPRYIDWLHQRDADGIAWHAGELRIAATFDDPSRVELFGVIDRVDQLPGDTIELIDYKTGGVAALREKVRQPLEDTQLAFYATLMATQTGVPMRATYLALDGTQRLEEVEHVDVQASAATLREGLAHDLRRLRAGAGMPALGEGATCGFCEARGVCRRDHWTVEREPAR